MPNPGDDIIKAKKKAVDELSKRVDSMGQAAYTVLLKAIEDTFDFKQGKIVADRGFIKQLNRLTIDVLDLLQAEPKFTGPVSQFVKRMPDISQAITDFQKAQNGINVPAFETAKKIIIDEILDKMLNNGLNANFVQPLRDLIYQNATGGLSLSDARVQIKAMTATTGKLGQYIEQTGKQAVTAYSGAISLKLTESFDFDGMLVLNPLIDNSSPQCRYAIDELGGTIKRSQWPKVEEIAKKNGLIKGTTFDTLPMNLLHWNCGHEFVPIIIKKAAA